MLGQVVMMRGRITLLEKGLVKSMKRYIYNKAKEYKNTFFRSRYMRAMFHNIYWKIRGVYWDYKSIQLRRSYAGIEPVKPKHTFVITLTKMPMSVKSTNKCIESGKVFGEDVEVFDAIDKFQSEEFLLSKGVVNNSDMNGAALGCFASHFVLWEKCVELGEPIVIIEHDAVFETPVPKMRFKDIIYISRELEQLALRKYPVQLRERNAKTREYYYSLVRLSGTCGYAVTPSGATKLIRAAKIGPITFPDFFINKSIVDICYLFPPIVRAEPSFSTIVNKPYGYIKKKGYFKEDINIENAWAGSNDAWKDYPS